MADILREVFGVLWKRYRDMGDGSHAEVILSVANDGLAAARAGNGI